MRGELIAHSPAGSASTMVYVTHDQVEAMTMADQIVVLNEGRVEQVGTPIEALRGPATCSSPASSALRRWNTLKGTFRRIGNGPAVETTSGAVIPLPGRTVELPDGAPVTLGIRPEHAEPGDSPYGVTVETTEVLGLTIVHARDGAGNDFALSLRGISRIASGDKLSIRFPRPSSTSSTTRAPRSAPSPTGRAAYQDLAPKGAIAGVSAGLWTRAPQAGHMSRPIFEDPTLDGAADPVVINRRGSNEWWMFYTNRRAAHPGPGVEWVHGSPIGIAVSTDNGASWQFRGNVAGLDDPADQAQHALGTGDRVGTRRVPHVPQLHHRHARPLAGFPAPHRPFHQPRPRAWTRRGVVDRLGLCDRCRGGALPGWPLPPLVQGRGARFGTGVATGPDLYTWTEAGVAIPGKPDGNPHEGP